MTSSSQSSKAHRRDISPPRSAACQAVADQKVIGGGGGGGGGENGKNDDGADGLVGLRQVRRHQKVKLWLSAFCETSGEVASASGSAPQPQASQQPNGPPGASVLTAWSALHDSGTFSAESGEESQLRSRFSTDGRSSFLRNLTYPNPRSQASLTSFPTVRSTQTSLNRLLVNRLRLRSCSDRTHQGEAYSVRSQTAEWLQHNTNTEVNSTTSEVQAGVPKKSAKPVVPSKKQLTKFLAKSVKPSNISEPPSTSPRDQRTTKYTDVQAGGGSSNSLASSSVEDEAPRKPEPYHVRIMPAMCYLVWRPNLMRRECLIERGQTAYLNALLPSSLPMEFLMAAAAARLDIEVPLLDNRRPDSLGKAPKFEYIFRWHSPNGPRVQLSDLITAIEHPVIQNGFPDTPVRIFLAGSPGWLSKAK